MWGDNNAKKKSRESFKKGLLSRVWRNMGSYKRWSIAFIALAKLKLIKAGGSRQQIIVASVTATAPFACQTWPRFVVSLDLNAFRPRKAVSSRSLRPPPKRINYSDIINDSFGCVTSFPLPGSLSFSEGSAVKWAAAAFHGSYMRGDSALRQSNVYWSVHFVGPWDLNFLSSRYSIYLTKSELQLSVKYGRPLLTTQSTLHI